MPRGESMCRKAKILLGILLLCMAAIIPLPFLQVEAGSASASDFQMKGDTLVKYTGTAGAVSIPTSVKKIGKEAFAGHTELVKVVIPGYVESIDYNAFAGCSSLRTVVIPDTVESIGNGAFSGCSSLESISLGKKLKKLGTGVFADCDALSSVSISSSNTSLTYSGGVIYSKDKKIIYTAIPGYDFGTYTMPSSVESMECNSFWGCSSLKKVEIGSKITEIPDYAFSNCQNLEKVMFPYSLKTIGLKAFADCGSLGEIQIPMSVANIHATAFDGCPALSIVAEEGSKAAEFEANRDKSAGLMSKYQGLAQEGQAEDSSNTEEAGQGETTAAAAAQSGARLLGQTRIVGGSAVVLMDNSGSNVMSGNVRPVDEADSSTQVMDSSGDGFQKYTIVNNEKIAAKAYYNNKGLKEYEIPDTVKEIGDFAFARSGLASIVIPEGVETIGYGAFYHCDDLAEVTIPSTVKEIEPSAFAETLWMKKQKENRAVPFTIAGDGILLSYSGMGSRVEIPEGVKQIGAEAFKGNTRITSVVLPESLITIGEDAFAGCSSLKSISGGSNLTQIRDRAFQGCPISTIKIPASVQQIGLRAFDISFTGKKDETKVAVFLGKQLPVVSYEETATRFSNTDYRECVFKDVQIAVVDGSITAEDIAGSVLDYGSAGFRGFICSVEQSPSGDNPGILRLKFCSIDKKDMTSDTIPEEVVVYGKTFQLSVPEGDLTYLSESTGRNGETGVVKVVTDSSTLPQSPAPSAQVEGSKENYILEIRDNKTDGSRIAAAYRKAVAGGRIVSLQVYDLTLCEARTMIPISRMGREKITVTLPKPNGIGVQKLRAVRLDEDGQLEKVEIRTVNADGTVCIQFEADGSGVYAIYN